MFTKMLDTFIQIVLLTILGLLVTQLAHAKTLYKTSEGEASKFNMCECMKEGYSKFPSKTEKDIVKMCQEVYIAQLMQESREKDTVAVGVFTSCQE